jgi:hypothetical protein
VIVFYSHSDLETFLSLTKESDGKDRFTSGLWPWAVKDQERPMRIDDLYLEQASSKV